MIAESYVSFETAKMLNEVGFDALCRGIYSTNRTGNHTFRECGLKNTKDDLSWNIADGFQYEYLAPTQALAARWLREEHGLFIEISYRITGFNYEIIYTGTNNAAFTPHEPKINFISYEGCLEDALQEAIKLIKNHGNNTRI